MGDLATIRKADPKVIEDVLIAGDLEKLSPQQRVSYYMAVCESTGLNPRTRPFEYIKLSGKLTLYARKDATDQLRRINNVSIYKLEQRVEGDLFIVTAYARTPDNREDVDVGMTSIAKLSGDNLVNAQLKAITKAKRRVTLSICGLGWLDETEIETVPDARRVQVREDGEIVEESGRPEPSLSPTRADHLAVIAQTISQLSALGHSSFARGEGQKNRIVNHIKKTAAEAGWDIEPGALEGLDDLRDDELAHYRIILTGELERMKAALKEQDDVPI